MNKCFIIGNLTADPESRTTQSGKRVVSFTVAVNRKGTDGTDFFRVSAWEKMGDVCAQYLSNGRKVSVIGEIRAGSYINRKGEAVGTLELTAHEVEFLSPKDAEDQYKAEERKAIQQEPKSSGFVEVNEELPF